MVSELDVRTVGDVTVIEPGARIRQCADELPPLVSEYLEQGRRKFVLNLNGVDFMDSAALGAIAQSHGFAARKAGRLMLCCCVPRLHRLFHTTKLSGVFEVFDTEDAAIRGFTASDDETTKRHRVLGDES